MLKVEPRLGPKLRLKFLELLNKPQIAKSVEYEIVKATFIHFMGDPESQVLVDKAVDKLRSFIKSSDPNLHYLGLEALQILITN